MIRNGNRKLTCSFKKKNPSKQLKFDTTLLYRHTRFDNIKNLLDKNKILYDKSIFTEDYESKEYYESIFEQEDIEYEEYERDEIDAEIFEQNQLNRYFDISRNKQINKYCFLGAIQGAYDLYIQTGQNSCSPDKVDYFHLFIKDEIDCFLFDTNRSEEYQVILEYPAPSRIPSKEGTKNCDIVIVKKEGGNYDIKAIFPVKMPMSSYGTAKISSFETLTGEAIALRWGCANYNIIPIYVWMHEERDKSCKVNAECVSDDCGEMEEKEDVVEYERDSKTGITFEKIKIYSDELVNKRKLIDYFIGCIIDVEHKYIDTDGMDTIVVKDFYIKPGMDFVPLRDILSEFDNYDAQPNQQAPREQLTGQKRLRRELGSSSASFERSYKRPRNY